MTIDSVKLNERIAGGLLTDGRSARTSLVCRGLWGINLSDFVSFTTVWQQRAFLLTLRVPLPHTTAQAAAHAGFPHSWQMPGYIAMATLNCVSKYTHNSDQSVLWCFVCLFVFLDDCLQQPSPEVMTSSPRLHSTTTITHHYGVLVMESELTQSWWWSVSDGPRVLMPSSGQLSSHPIRSKFCN